LKYATWVTLATCCVMLGLAIVAGVRDSYSDKNLATRSNVVWIWIIIQALFIAFGVFRKRMLPCAHHFHPLPGRLEETPTRIKPSNGNKTR
jgi:hypothetical protein